MAMKLNCHTLFSVPYTFVTVCKTILQSHETSSVLLKSEVSQAIRISLGKMCLKELVVALELSKNDAVLGEILKWTEAELEKPAETAVPVTVRASHYFMDVF